MGSAGSARLDAAAGMVEASTAERIAVIGTSMMRVALTTGVLVALTSCSGGSGSESEVGVVADAQVVDEDDAGAVADPALNEAITVALPQLPRKLDPLDDLEPWAQRIADDLVFEGLVRRTPDRYPWAEPAIADRCEVDREYAVATVTCHIPTGVQFHDGRELTMDDVVYSLSFWIDRRRTWIRERHGLFNLERIEIVDGPPGARANERDPGRWVRIGFDKREPLALEALSAIKIVPRDLHRGSRSKFSQSPVGTGPMQVTTLESDRIVLERFAGYHDPERRTPTGKIVFRAMADGAEALTALRRGEVHLLPELAPVHAPVELGKPGMSGRFQAWLVSPAHYDILLWNVAEGIQSGPALRAALHDALPISGIARTVFRGPGLPIQSPVDLHSPAPIDLGVLEDIKAGEAVRGGLLAMPSLDEDTKALERAAGVLDRLDWPLEQGLRRRSSGALRVALTWNVSSGRPAMTAAAIRDAWAGIGVIMPEATASWNYVMTLLRRGEFKVALVHLGGHSDQDLHPLFHSRGASNFSGVDDPALDEALSDYRGAPDREARDAAKQRISQRLAELRVVSVLYAPAHVMLASRRLTGIEFVDDIPRLDRLGLTPGDIDWGS